MSRLIDGHDDLGCWHELASQSSVNPLGDFITLRLQGGINSTGRKLAWLGVKFDIDGGA
jgi:hypothetical protein